MAFCPREDGHCLDQSRLRERCDCELCSVGEQHRRREHAVLAQAFERAHTIFLTELELDDARQWISALTRCESLFCTADDLHFEGAHLFEPASVGHQGRAVEAQPQ